MYAKRADDSVVSVAERVDLDALRVCDLRDWQRIDRHDHHVLVKKRGCVRRLRALPTAAVLLPRLRKTAVPGTRSSPRHLDN